jgi:hypothetical protein
MRVQISPAWAGPAAASAAAHHSKHIAARAACLPLIRQDGAPPVTGRENDRPAIHGARAGWDRTGGIARVTANLAAPAAAPARRWPIEGGGSAIAVAPLRPAPLAEVDEQRATRSRGGTMPCRAAFRTGAGVDDPIALCEIGSPID